MELGLLDCSDMSVEEGKGLSGRGVELQLGKIFPLSASWISEQ